MNLFKSPVAQLARLFQASRDHWKARALDKQRRLRAAQVKIRDLETSRAQWKARALAAEGARAVPRERPSGAGEPMDATSDDPPPPVANAAPAGHGYPVLVIQLALRLYLHAMLGSRGVVTVLELLPDVVAAPRHTTVLNWLYRCGLALLKRVAEQRTDWIWIADHTLAVGPLKCLVILGIPLSNLKHIGYSPSHRDLQVLAVECTVQSTGDWVAAVFARVAQRWGIPVQIVADAGSDLRKGTTTFQASAPACVATYDISHAIANVLKRELGTDVAWTAFLQHCRTTLASFQQTALAFLLPPRQRTKARFMNLDAHIGWAQRLLAYFDRGDFSAIDRTCILTWPAWETLCAQFGAPRVQPLRALVAIRYPDRRALRTALQAHGDLDVGALDATFWSLTDRGHQRFLDAFAWLLPYRDALVDYAQMMKQSKQIQSYLKSHGLHAGSRRPLQATLAPPSALTPRAQAFTAAVLAQVDQQAAKIPLGMIGLASSDIIESVFGKYKLFATRGPLKDIGKLVLTIPAFLADLTLPLVRHAMESVGTRDVEDWANTHLGISMLTKRRQALIPSAAPT
jgi:hypothetical protein